jgi:hypothetical protein
VRRDTLNIPIEMNTLHFTRILTIMMIDYYFPKIDYQIPTFPKINYQIPDPYDIESGKEPLDVIDKKKPKLFQIKVPKKMEYHKSTCVKKPVFIPNMDDVWLKKSMEIMVIWNDSIKHISALQAVKLPTSDNVTKVFIKTLKICRKFLNGNLINSKDFNPPYNIDVEKRRYSIDEFKMGLSEFISKLPKIHWIHKRKTRMTLVEFLAGEQVYANIQSQFFLYFKPSFVGRDTEEMSIMTDRWLLLTGEDEVSLSDKKNFSDSYTRPYQLMNGSTNVIANDKKFQNMEVTFINVYKQDLTAFARKIYSERLALGRGLQAD